MCQMGILLVHFWCRCLSGLKKGGKKRQRCQGRVLQIRLQSVVRKYLFRSLFATGVLFRFLTRPSSIDKGWRAKLVTDKCFKYGFCVCFDDCKYIIQWMNFRTKCMGASIRSKWRPLSISFVKDVFKRPDNVKDIAHSRITSISCRLRLSTLAAKAEPTVSWGSDELC